MFGKKKRQIRELTIVGRCSNIVLEAAFRRIDDLVEDRKKLKERIWQLEDLLREKKD